MKKFIQILLLFFIIAVISQLSLFSQEQLSVLDEPLDFQEDEIITGTTEENPAPLSIWEYIKMVLVLGIVVGIIYLIFFLFKKGLGKKIVENELINILGSRIISGNKALHIVEIGKSVYLIGSASESVNLISEINDKETKDTIKIKASAIGNRKNHRFSDVLSNLFKNPFKNQVTVNQSLDFIKKQQSRLKKMG